MQPDSQTIYRDAKGDLILYVRSEERNGGPLEHLFVKTRDRAVFQVWAEAVPEGAELVMDAEGRKQCNEARWLLQTAEHNVEILVTLLKDACAMLPRERAQELRRRYQEAQP